MRSQFLISLAATAMLAGAAYAADFTPPGTSPDAVPTGAYVLDKSHASVVFNLSHMGFSRYFGRFNTLDAALNFDTANPEQSTLKATIDMDSVDTNNAKLEGELKSSQWFNTSTYPKATFTSTKVEKLSDTTGKIHGDLTLRGVTKPVVLDVTFNGAGIKPMANVPALGFSATTTISRSEFGISNYVPMVGDAVTLTIETEFHHDAPKKK